LLRGAALLEDLADSFEVTHSRPFGHVAAVLGTLRRIGLETDLVLAAEKSRLDLVKPAETARECQRSLNP